ncbi:MAG TPA: hypothetical protein VHW46_08600, partial [Terracidiphilus sp.]|nr:hypothetical protein [Terracidiphilus sp.]
HGAVAEIEPIPFERLKGLSQPRAMIAIAKHNRGFLRTRDLTRILVASGLMKLTKNSQSIASRLIRDSERFERITDGFYKLRVTEPQGQAVEVAAESAQRLQ